MATLRALIVGVSDYSAFNPQNNLPFCKNDISVITTAFVDGLKVEPANIITCGGNGIVSSNEIISALQQLAVIAESDDTILFYFSGHGSTLPDGHHLVLSDCYLNTQTMIALLEAISAKSKILFLDCCMAGNFSIGNTAIFSIDETADEFAGKGYAVFASSNASQPSYGHPNKPISLYTSFLCAALTYTSIIREGRKSLHDINRLLFLFLEIWNKNNPDRQQSPIYRANIGGTIYFSIQDYIPYAVGDYFEECDNCIIYKVEPTHSGIAKRYSVRVILKQPLSLLEISTLNHKIVNKVKFLNIYQSERQRNRWESKAANLVFCYWGLDETDMKNCNYLCHTTWADDTQDKGWWYRISSNHEEVINNIHFNVHTYYQSLKTFTADHTGTREDLIRQTRAILSSMVTLAEKAISIYNEFLNGLMEETELVENMKNIISSIDKLYFEEGDLDIPPDELKEWSQCCTCLSSSIHDFTLLYNPQYLSRRDPENRKACMDIAIKQYYSDLEKLKQMDVSISSLV